MVKREHLFIGGRWQAPASAERIEVVSPTTETIVGSVPMTTGADIDLAVAAAHKAMSQGPWPRMSVAERADVLLNLAETIKPALASIVDMQIDEMGSPRQFAASHTLSFGYQVQYWIDIAKAVPETQVRAGHVGQYLVRREPAGVVGAVIPWNAPFGILASKVLPALLAGCAIVVKPAAESPLSAMLISDAILASDLPEGLVSILPGGAEAGEALISHPGVDKVTFTGSGQVGRRIASICGSQLKPVTLELGGKSAAVILDDADLDRDLDVMLANALPNTGQVCHATTRILAPASRYDEVVDRIATALAKSPVGDPHDEAVQFGPLVSQRQRQRVEDYIASGIDAGARLVLGGDASDQDRGWYVRPTVFAHVENSMRIAQEEIFGPVLSVINYDDDDDAVRIANDSKYGLGGAVFTTDVERGIDLAARIQTGTIQINDGASAGGGGPFGGVKESGIGRELGAEGLMSYQQLKSISLPVGYAYATASV